MSTVHSSIGQSGRRSSAPRSTLRSPPPKPKAQFDRPPVPPLPLQFVQPQSQPQPLPKIEVAVTVKVEVKVERWGMPEPRRQPRRDPRRHDHLVDFRPRAGIQFQSMKCKLIALHEAQKRASIVYHSVLSV
ncbi:hypothetical protein C2E23DRAFT_889256 [Lenzites betulinus]|nr:hypothetical protein C2E23DRAFT_889256 [Lenzites betulinus]